MKRVLKFIAIHTLFWITAESLYSRVCHEGFEPFLDSCLYFSRSEESYSESVETCRSFNPSAWLFVPYDEYEVDAMKNKIDQAYFDTTRFFRLGIKQPPGLGVSEGWYWGSGKEIATNRWCSGEPDDHDNSIDERDVIMDAEQHFCFRDIPEVWNTHYICKQAHAGVIANIGDQDENLRPLFDFDIDTCLNVLNTLFKMRRNRLDLIIPQKIEDGLVSVYFSQKVVCEARKIIYEFKKSTECKREYVKLCDLVTTGSETRTSCEYRCRCEQDGCRIVFIEEFGNQPVDICEISYEYS